MAKLVEVTAGEVINGFGWRPSVVAGPPARCTKFKRPLNLIVVNSGWVSCLETIYRGDLKENLESRFFLCVFEGSA